MTLLTLGPNGTTSNSMVLVGGATAHAVLDDASDASYAGPAGTAGRSFVVTLDDVTLAAGAISKSIFATFRQAGTASPSQWQMAMFNSDVSVNDVQVFPATSSITTLQSAFFSHAGLTDAQMDSLSLQVTALSGTGQVYLASVGLIYVVLPTLNVTAPTGTITTTNTPLVAWSATLDSDGGPQTAFEVKIYSAAQYGAGGFSPDTSTSTLTSGIMASSPSTASWQPTTALANATYRAYVRIAQTVGTTTHWSAWDFEGFTINVTAPSAPSLTLTAQSTDGRIRAVLDDNGALSTDRFELQRSVDGGTTWEAVRIHDDYAVDDNPGVVQTITPGAAITLYDYEAPNGTLTSYRARALHNYSGLYAASAWTSTATATWTSTSWWLKDPAAPALNLVLTNRMASYGNVDRAARQGVFQALGASLPIVISDTRAGAVGTLVLNLITAVERVKLNALLDNVRTLLIQGPVADGEPDRYVRIGDHNSVRPAGKSFSPVTTETLSWVETDAPSDPQSGAQYA